MTMFPHADRRGIPREAMTLKTTTKVSVSSRFALSGSASSFYCF